MKLAFLLGKGLFSFNVLEYLLNGKYASARSAGNYLAGMNAAVGTLAGGRKGFISSETNMKLAGAVHKGKYNKTIAASIVITGEPTFAPEPYYGEIPYAGRMIKAGFAAGKKKRKSW